MQRQQCVHHFCPFVYFHAVLTRRLTAYSQCRTQDPTTGSWADDPSWQCQAPGGTATGNTLPAIGGGTTQSGGGAVDPNAGVRSGQALPGSQQLAASNTDPSSGNGGATQNPGSSGGTTTSGMSGQGGNGGSPTGGTQAVQSGTCGSTSAPAGWDGVASTSVSPISHLLLRWATT